jgi:xylulose-5-phosphate/fructose-6-phosphate phosphoketolase
MRLYARLPLDWSALTYGSRHSSFEADMPDDVNGLKAKLVTHHDYVRRHGEDMPEVRDWRWKR